MDPGFGIDDVVTAQVEPGARQYTGQRLNRYYADVTERLRAIPGVRQVTLAQFGFLTGAATTGTVDVPGYTPASDDERLLHVYQVGADYFTTLGVKIVQGRDFAARDLTGAPVAAINESAARRFFGVESAIGRTLVTSKRQFEIVAVTRDARANALRMEPVPTFFVPYTNAIRGRMTFLVRTATASVAPAAVSAAIRALDPDVPITITTIGELHARNVSQERLLATLTTAFAATAVFLLALGVYAMMAFAVTQRISEIGVRLALGSSRTAVMWAVLRQPLLLITIGSAIGLAATLAGGRFVASLLFGLTPQDPLTLLSAVVLLAIVGTLAGYVPARRASRVDPVVALRCN
jgi:predicted permease